MGAWETFFVVVAAIVTAKIVEVLASHIEFENMVH